MTRNHLVSILILSVATVFIVYTVIDNLATADDPLDFLTNGNSQINQNSEADGPFVPKDETGLQKGMFAPDFTLRLWESDQEQSLSSYRGHFVVLNLWASWCPPCRDEMPDLIKLSEEYQDQGVKVVGINMSTLESNEEAIAEFMDVYKVTFPTFLDQPVDTINQRGVIESLYQVRAIPATYILDKEGRIFMPIRGKVNYQMLETELKKLLE